MTEQQASDDLVKTVEDRLRAHESSLERRYAGLRSQIQKQREELDRWRERFEADVSKLLETLERIEKESTSRLEQSLQLMREAQTANEEEHGA